MKIVCEEHDKYGSRRPARYILRMEVNGRLISNLQLRSMFNPTLRGWMKNIPMKKFWRCSETAKCEKNRFL